MAGASLKAWLVWYDNGHPSHIRTFDTREEALEYQADPKGTTHLGDKNVMRISYVTTLWGSGEPVPGVAGRFLRNEVERLPGPETIDESKARWRRESIDAGVALIADARSDEVREKNTLKLLAEQPELTREWVAAQVNGLLTLRASRKRGPRKDKGVRPHA
jgi:hypothetical protein